MKKNYHKPDVFFEDFAFSSNIASGCGTSSEMHALDSCKYYATFGNITSCQFYDNGYVLFQSYGPCLEVPQEEVPGNLCYHVSGDDSRIFNS